MSKVDEAYIIAGKLRKMIDKECNKHGVNPFGVEWSVEHEEIDGKHFLRCVSKGLRKPHVHFEDEDGDE